MKSAVELSFVQVLKARLQAKSSFIQVVLGPRQVGKTTGVLQCIAQLKLANHYASADAILSPQATWIIEQWQAARLKDKSAILVIDEIQKIQAWDEIIKKLWDEQKRAGGPLLKVVLLGSSSLSIQKGLTESLTGRFELIRVHHWNYAESIRLKKMKVDEYLRYGGYPASYAFVGDEPRFRSYIKESILETVIGRDIFMFSQVRSPALFRQAFEILSAYPAQEISYSKLLGQLQDKGNIDLVKNYLNLYAGAYLIKTLEKYSAKAVLKKSSSPKILLACPALANLGENNAENTEYKGRLFELAVGLELARLPGELYYWREGKYEVDFIYKNAKKLYAIEVKSGRSRSAKGLNAFIQKFPQAKAIIVSPDNFMHLSQQGEDFLTLLG